MEYLKGTNAQEAERYLHQAASIASASTCARAHCGTVIVKDDQIIGAGYNSTPAELESQRRCETAKDHYDSKVTDKTCCVHAEQRAIIDALQTHSGELSGARLYFVRVMDEGVITKAGEPYCTICSKMALDVGIAEFVLWHEKGICVYGTEEYNDLSFISRC